MFKVNNKNTKTTLLTSFWCFCCYLWIHFMFNVSIVDFEQVNVSWVIVAAAQIQSFKPRFTQQKYLSNLDFQPSTVNKLHCYWYWKLIYRSLTYSVLYDSTCLWFLNHGKFFREKFRDGSWGVHAIMAIMMKKNALVKYCCYIVFELKKILPKWFGLSGIQNNFSFVNQEKLWFRLIFSFHANVPLLYPLKNVRKPELWKTILLIWIVICIGF